MIKVALFARAWIEIDSRFVFRKFEKVALFARAWIEIPAIIISAISVAVALFARAWIEMILKTLQPPSAYCRPLCEGVD